MTILSTRHLAAAIITVFSLAFSACQKERTLSHEETALPGYGSAQSLISNAKQDRKILFVSNRDGNDEIYAMNLDGTNIVRLTYNNVPDGRASWSSNGQHIAFASGAAGSRDIFIMNANGQALKNLTNTPDADEDFPEWSPQGNRIIFSSNRDGNHQIFVSDPDGENLVQLTHTPQDDKWPTYSPDGSLIAFQSDLGTTSGRTEVFIMNADGTDVTRLTHSPALDQMPAWSPDGSKIAFMTSRDGDPEVYVMYRDGSGQTRLTNTPAVDGRPSWSKEGYGIVFTSARDFNLPSMFAKFEIYSMDEDGSNQRRLTSNSVYDDFPYIK
jgi:TolB protein